MCAGAPERLLRRGADQIKVMANGGCVSPTDELTSVQFTAAGLRAAVEEAVAQGKYVMAHTYTAASMTNYLNAGVRTLEHGNFISSEVAEQMARRKRAYRRSRLVDLQRPRPYDENRE
jgi:imidazolonepropionase-like amidohydrolase